VGGGILYNRLDRRTSRRSVQDVLGLWLLGGLSVHLLWGGHGLLRWAGLDGRADKRLCGSLREGYWRLLAGWPGNLLLDWCSR
jgi:hypothetical protein